MSAPDPAMTALAALSAGLGIALGAFVPTCFGAASRNPKRRS